MKNLKFTRLKFRKSSESYFFCESNKSDITLLAFFLKEECTQNGIEYYLEFLKQNSKHPYQQRYGNLTNLSIDGEQVQISENFPDTESSLIYKITPQSLIGVINSWKQLTIENDLSVENIIIEDFNGLVKLESTLDDDPRFSRIVKDNAELYAFIEKSDIFDNYWRAEGNEGSLFKISRVLGDYINNKNEFDAWLKNNDREYLRNSNIYSLCKDNNRSGIEIDLKLWQETDLKRVEYPIKIEDFIKLLHESYNATLNPEIKRINIHSNNGRLTAMTMKSNT